MTSRCRDSTDRAPTSDRQPSPKHSRATLTNRAIDDLPQLSLSDPVQLFLALIQRPFAPTELPFLRVQLVETCTLARGQPPFVRIFERIALPFELARLALDLSLL